MRQTNKTSVTLPMVQSSYPDLQTAILEERARQKASANPSTHVVVCEMTGRPWQAEIFSHHFREIASACGIPPGLQYRDLRATAATELSNSGADIIHMSTHTGHKTASMARRYARPSAEQFQQAAAARQASKKKTSGGMNEAGTASETASETRKQAVSGLKKTE
jgi:site-specific recombinase XerD